MNNTHPPKYWALAARVIVAGLLGFISAYLLEWWLISR